MGLFMYQRTFLQRLFFCCLTMLPFSSIGQTASEQVVQIRVDKTHRVFSSGQIQATLFTPPISNPTEMGVVIVNHGGIGLPAERAVMKRPRYPSIAKVFLDMGFMVALPLRRGHGASGGPWADEFYGNSARPDYIGGGYSASDDILATATYAASLPGVDKSKIFVVGQSLGGWASLAALAKDKEQLIAGVINFAGGIGYYREHLRGLEHPHLLIEGAEYYGSQSTKPALWIYTPNDSRFSVQTIQSMFGAYKKGNSMAKLEMFPAFGTDGHALFGAGSKLWERNVRLWLEKTLGDISLPSFSINVGACQGSGC